MEKTKLLFFYNWYSRVFLSALNTIANLHFSAVKPVGLTATYRLDGKHLLQLEQENKTMFVKAFKVLHSAFHKLVDSQRTSLSRSFKYLALVISSLGIRAFKAMALLLRCHDLAPPERCHIFQINHKPVKMLCILTCPLIVCTVLTAAGTDLLFHSRQTYRHRLLAAKTQRRCT